MRTLTLKIDFKNFLYDDKRKILVITNNPHSKFSIETTAELSNKKTPKSSKATPSVSVTNDLIFEQILKSDIVTQANILKADIDLKNYKLILFDIGDRDAQADKDKLLKIAFQLLPQIRLVTQTPLVLVGNISKAYVLEEDRNNKQLLSKLGFYYYNLSESFPLEVSPISDLLWEDLKFFVCSKIGLLSELWHNLKDIILGHDYEQNVINSFDNLKKIFVEELDNPTALKRVKEKVLEALNKSKLEDRRQILNHYRGELFSCFKFADTDTTDNTEFTVQPVTWEILYLDDKYEDSQLLASRFQLDNQKVLCKVNIAHSGEEALKILRENRNINVLISDYRLENDEGNWQPMQGYDVVEAVLKDPKILPVSCFMLTNKQAIIRLQSRQLSRQPIPWYTKDDVFSNGGFNIFWKAVNVAGNNIIQHRFSLTGTAWHKSTGENYNKHYALNVYYKAYSQNKNYDDICKTLNQSATKFIAEALLLKTQSNYQINLDNYMRVDSTSSDFGTCKFPLKNEYIEKDLSKFHLRLLGRRIFYGLNTLLKEDFDKDEYLSILFKGRLPNKNNEENFNGYLSSYLAIYKSFEYLPEEKQWLEALQTAISDKSQKIYDVLKEIIVKTRENLEKNNKNLLDKSYEQKYKNIFYFQDAKRIDAQRIKDIQQFLTEKNAYKDIQEQLLKTLKNLIENAIYRIVIYKTNRRLFKALFDYVHQ